MEQLKHNLSRFPLKSNTTNKIFKGTEKGFDIRIVKYESLHNISEEDFSIFVKAISPSESDCILDVGAGYGAATREIVKRNSHKNVHYFLSDKSSVQLSRAKLALAPRLSYAHTKSSPLFFQDDIVHSNFRSESFDKVVGKMVLHEIDQQEQGKAIKEIYRILKPFGSLIIWDVVLDKPIQRFVQSVIKKKDELAGFEDLARFRYLFTQNEIFGYLENAGFTDIDTFHHLEYVLNTSRRLDPEFNGDIKKLHKWNHFIVEEYEKLDSEAKSKINLTCNYDNCRIHFGKQIIRAFKI